MTSLAALPGDGLAVKPLFRMSLLKGEITSVLLHIRRGAPVNGRDERGLTPLMLAAAAGRHDICLLLLAEGAEPALITRDGQTASDLARNAGHTSVGEALRPARPAAPPPGSVVVQTILGSPVAPALEGLEDLGARFADGGWESLEEFAPVLSDPTVAAATRQAQDVLGARRGENDDTPWQDIHVALPSVSRRFTLGEALAGIDAQIASAVAAGRVPERARVRLVRRLAGLQAVLDDLGVRPENAFETFVSRQLTPAILDATDQDRLADATELIAALAAESGSSAFYRREVLRLPSIDRDAEQSMFRALAEAKRQVLRALIACLPLVEDVLRAGLTQAAARPDDEDADPDDELSCPDVDARDNALVAALLAVRGGNWSADVDRLAEIDLDLRLVETVRHALGRTSSGGVAAGRLGATIDRYLAVRNRVIEANLPLVLRTAPWFRRPGVDPADLIQEGNIGLMRAVERFDSTRGNRFSTFAVWWVRQACRRVTEDLSRTIRLPVHIVETCSKISRAARALNVTLGRRPSYAELATETGIPIVKVRTLYRAWRRTISLDDPRICDYAPRIVDAAASDAIAHTLDGERRRIVGEVLARLPHRQERIVRSRFGLGGCADQTLEEVGEQFGVTRERIRQLEHKTLVSLGRPGAAERKLLRALL